MRPWCWGPGMCCSMSSWPWPVSREPKQSCCSWPFQTCRCLRGAWPGCWRMVLNPGQRCRRWKQPCSNWRLCLWCIALRAMAACGCIAGTLRVWPSGRRGQPWPSDMDVLAVIASGVSRTRAFHRAKKWAMKSRRCATSWQVRISMRQPAWPWAFLSYLCRISNRLPLLPLAAKCWKPCRSITPTTPRSLIRKPEHLSPLGRAPGPLSATARCSENWRV